MPSPFDLQARIRALHPQTDEEQIGSAFDKRRLFLEGMLSERGILDSGIADTDILSLEQDRINALDQSRRGRGGGGGGVGGGGRLVFDEPETAPAAPTGIVTRTLGGKPPPPIVRQKPPEMIANFQRALREADRRASEVRGRSTLGPSAGQLSGPPRGAVPAGQLSGPPRGAVPAGQLSPPGGPANFGGGSPEQMFRSELDLARRNPTERSEMDLARSVVGAWGRAEHVRVQRLQLEQDQSAVEEDLTQKLRILTDTAQPTGLDPATGERLAPDAAQIRHREQATQALQRQLLAHRAQQAQEQARLESIQKMQEARVEREYQAYVRKVDTIRASRTPADRVAMRGYMERGAREIAQFIGLEDRGRMRAYQTVMTALKPADVEHLLGRIASGLTRDEAMQEARAAGAQ